MRTDTRHSFRLGIMTLLLMACAYVMGAPQAAGTTVDKATRVSAPTKLTVQSGSNYIRIASEHLPATVTYMADTAFGPIPTALLMGDTIEAQVVFELCQTAWRWQLTEADNDQIMEIKAHENASILVNVHMCDITYSDTTATACSSFEWRGTTYTESGDYSITLINAAGCDSIRTLHLTINQPTTGEETETACDSLYWNGEWYKESGDYTFETTNTAGCDSTVTLHLTVHHSYHITLPDTIGCVGNSSDGYWFIDTLITTPGTYTRHKKTQTGCDSIVTQYVSIAEETYATDKVTAYDSCTWMDGRTYYVSGGGPIWTLTNAAGCDSVVDLNLTIRHIAVNDTVSEAVCLAPGESYPWNGKNYSESGTYTTDTLLGPAVSKIYMDTLHTLVLTVNRTYAVDTVVKVCADQYIWRGTTYTESGDYPYVGQTTAMCDSVVTLHLTLNQPTASEISVSACESYTWKEQTYTESGDYTYTTTNAAGCDSIVTLHLTIEPDCAEYDTVYYCKGFNTPHDERVSNELIRRYLPYTFESPNTWDYMEGVIVDGEPARTLVDFRRAESNLYAHYVDGLTPVERIIWSVRYDEKSPYIPLEIGDEPQWIAVGMLAVQVQFRCGEIFNTAFPTALGTVNADSQIPTKRIENGQVVILRGDAVYTPMGQKIK